MKRHIQSQDEMRDEPRISTIPVIQTNLSKNPEMNEGLEQSGGGGRDGDENAQEPAH